MRVLRQVRRSIDKHIYYPLNNWWFDRRYSNQIDIMNEDWDNLIILDACRYDYFEEKKDQLALDGRLRKVISKAGSSRKFLRENFSGRKLHDTVQVTANLHIEKLEDDVFYTVEPIPASERNPEKVVEATKRMYEQYPNKRLIVHLMQPHPPYLGPTADRLRDELDDEYLMFNSSIDSSEHVKPKIDYAAFKQGLLPIEDLHTIYEENLEIAIRHTNELLDYLDGKTVITADHGELLGERKGVTRERKFGHPHSQSRLNNPTGARKDLKTLEVRAVPWYVIDTGERREITAETPIGFERLDEEVVKGRLRELGYVDPDV